MAKCSNCGEEVVQTKGKKPRLYCNDACRMKLKRRVSHTIQQAIPNIKSEQSKANTKTEQPKRGADIKTFEDLPPDVQHTIETMSSRPDAPVDDKAKRTARAIHYQHLFPDRYYSTGLCPQAPQAAPVQPICSG